MSNNTAQEKRIPVEFKKQSFKEFAKSLGPGIIFVLTALGAGDLIDSSVSGSHYGYALMWAFALAVLVRFLIVNTMARFDLCNTNGMTLLEGYRSLSKFYPYFFIIYCVILGHILNASMIKGCGEALYHLAGFGTPVIWSVITMLLSLFIAGKSVYGKLELVMKLILAVLTVCFFGLAIAAKPDAGQIVNGIIGFELPAGTGVFGSLTVVISLIGAVAGSMTNFLYPHAMREKGWTDATYKKIQRNELLFSVTMLILLNLAIWVVGAEILRPMGIKVTSLQDIAAALGQNFGAIGSVLFYVGVFGVVWSSFLGHASGYSKIVIENLQMVKPDRAKKYGKKFENDPIYRYISLFILVSPLIWLIPGTPNFVVMTILANTLNTIALPVIAIGLLVLSNKRSILKQFSNSIFENVILGGCVILAIWGSIKIVMGFING